VAAIVTIACVFLGYPVAYAAANRSGTLRAVILTAVLLPFWSSILVRSYAFMVLLGRESLLARFLTDIGFGELSENLLFSRFGALVGMIYVMLPYMVLSLFAVMRNVDHSYLRAARSLGATPWQAFRRVYLPLTYSGLVGGVLMVFIVSIGFFITPALLGGRREVFIAQMIKEHVTDIVDWGFASALAIALLAVTCFLLYVYDRLLGADSLLDGQGRFR
jgi:ABC-type spermidine/putrescine transport system permease subunit I